MWNLSVLLDSRERGESGKVHFVNLGLGPTRGHFGNFYPRMPIGLNSYN